MNPSNNLQPGLTGRAGALSQLLALVTASFLIAFSAGCASRQPPPVVIPSAPVAVRPSFNTVGASPLADRSSVSTQAAVSEANRVWSSSSVSRADYLRASRILCAVIEGGDITNAEDAIRLSVMALEMAILSNDRTVMVRATRAWELAFRELNSAPNRGEVEMYLVACRATGQQLPSELLDVANPEVRSLLAD